MGRQVAGVETGTAAKGGPTGTSAKLGRCGSALPVAAHYKKGLSRGNRSRVTI